MSMVELPEYAQVVRTLPLGIHPYRSLLPRIEESRALRRIAKPGIALATLLDSARVKIKKGNGYLWVDVNIPAIILIDGYYRNANSVDLYLDLVHELTHLRQLCEGKDLWDHSLPYVDRPTEIEGYAVAVEEGLRLGMTEEEIIRHLSNPWLSASEIERLRKNIACFLGR